MGEGALELAIGEEGSPFHHMNCIGIELAGDAGFRLALSEAEHTQTLDEDDGGVRVAEGR